MKKLNIRMIAYLGMLTALGVVLAALRPVSLWNFRISFTFLPIAAAGMLFGPVSAGVVGALSDVLGAFLFPAGTFFPGYTLTAFVNGLCWGLPFLHKKRTVPRLLLAVGSSLVLCTLLLNTLWISVTHGSPYLPQLMRRLVQAGIMAPVQFLAGGLMMGFLERNEDKMI